MKVIIKRNPTTEHGEFVVDQNGRPTSGGLGETGGQ